MFFKYVQITLSIISGIVLVPVYLRDIPFEMYGTWLAIGSVVIWLAAFDPGIANLLIQRIGQAHGASNTSRVRGFANAGIFVAAIISVTIAVVGILLAPIVLTWLSIVDTEAGEFKTAFCIASGTTGMMVMGFSLTGILLGLQRSMATGLLLLSASIIKIITVLCLLQYNIGMLALPYSNFASALWILLGGGGLVTQSLYSESKKHAGLKYLREMATLFSFSLGARLGKVVTRNIDNFFIVRLLGAEAVGMYSLTATIPRQAENLINQPVAALRPAISHLEGEGNKELLRKHLVRILRFIFWAIGSVAAGIWALNYNFMTLWVGQEYFAGTKVAFLLCLVFVINVWSHSLGTFGFSLGDIKRNSLMEWASSLLRIPGVFLGAHLGGLAGIVSAHAMISLFTLAWYFPWSLYKRTKMSYLDLRALLYEIVASAGGATISIFLFSQIETPTWSTFMKILFLLQTTYFGFLFATSPGVRKEIKTCLIFIKQYKMS